MIVLIRHAQTDMAGRFCGQSDPELNAIGRDQLTGIAEQASSFGIERIWSSDLRRVRQTAQAISQRVGADVQLTPNLREIHFGAWEGMGWNQISAAWPHEAELWLREPKHRSAPQGETYAQFAARIEAEFTRLLEREDQVIAVVTHRGVMMHVLTKLFGWEEQDAWERTALYGVTIPIDKKLSSVFTRKEMRNCERISV